MKERIKWIDCAKFIAICAVACDHCYKTLYASDYLGKLTYFSVSLFVLLSGISHSLAANRRVISQESHFRNLCLKEYKGIEYLFFQYSLATLIIYILKERFFDFKTYINYILNFNLSGPYYFIVFFIQILFIAPFILLYIKRINKFKYKYIVHIISIIILILIAKVCINDTYIIKVHGGGQFLFGGTFIVLFYIGGALNEIGLFRNEQRMPMFFLGLICAVVCGISICNGSQLDRATGYFLGEGINPPGFDIILYSVAILLICYAVFSAKQLNNTYIVTLIAKLGKNTMVIFLYHSAVLSVLGHAILPKSQSIVVRVIIYILIIVLPVLGKDIVSIILNKVKAFLLEGFAENGKAK